MGLLAYRTLLSLGLLEVDPPVPALSLDGLSLKLLLLFFGSAGELLLSGPDPLDIFKLVFSAIVLLRGVLTGTALLASLLWAVGAH